MQSLPRPGVPPSIGYGRVGRDDLAAAPVYLSVAAGSARNHRVGVETELKLQVLGAHHGLLSERVSVVLPLCACGADL